MIRALVIALGVAAPAQGCPTRADMERGVTFVRTDGSRVEHVAQGHGFVTIETLRASGTSLAKTATLHGIHRIGPAGDAMALDEDAQDLITAPQLGALNRRVRVLSTGEEIRVQTFTQPVPVQKRIGACVMEVWRVGQTEDTPGLSVFRAFDYFPTLGTGVLVGLRVEAGDELTSAVESMRW
ncbi:MAG: hypothetical protein ACU0CI_01140 [Shimia sp.]